MAKILIVDDEEIVLKSISALLRGEGYETVMCESVPDALEARKAEKFDLIITDIRMAPIDGMEFMRIVHEEEPGFPIIVISAYNSEKTMAEGFKQGCSAYLAKPFRVQDVLDAVEAALGK